MDLIPWRSKSRSRNGGNSPQPLATIRDEIDHVLERFLRDPWDIGRPGTEMGTFPRLDLVESEDDVTVRAELPGVSPKSVTVEVTAGVLKVSGEKAEEREEKRADFVYSERQFGSFVRTVALPAAVDPDRVEASFKDGVLTVRIAKRPDARPKKITVRNG